MESKLTRFTESETPGKYRRKMIEFESYRVRCGINNEEVRDDLYLECKTPLKQKLIAVVR